MMSRKKTILRKKKKDIKERKKEKAVNTNRRHDVKEKRL